ncbi:MAG: hypothetical protein IPJ54_09695 [Saprospiraceae bacterium]|nr:hypothetical protein [Saprospiraceae bacterium]
MCGICYAMGTVYRSSTWLTPVRQAAHRSSTWLTPVRQAASAYRLTAYRSPLSSLTAYRSLLTAHRSSTWLTPVRQACPYTALAV